jgi:hypothetical protein
VTARDSSSPTGWLTAVMCGVVPDPFALEVYAAQAVMLRHAGTSRAMLLSSGKRGRLSSSRGDLCMELGIVFLSRYVY